MAFTDEFADCLAELEGEIPQSFIWEGNEYPCFASGATKGGRLEAYGWGVHEDLIIIVRGSLFGGTYPDKNDAITFISRHPDGTERERVSLIVDHDLTAPNSCYLRLACMNADRGA